MDRLFLQGLAAELRPRLAGRRVRSAVVDREGGLLSLSLGPGSALYWSFVPDVAGPFLAEPRSSGAATPGLKTRVVTASISELECAELDRIVTLRLDQTKLSGRRASSELVLEVISNRVATYLLDGESRTIVETFALSRSRLSSGERYEAPPLPPAAAARPPDADAFELRLAHGRSRGLSRRAALLEASGLTPRLARELEWLVEEEKRGEAEAFELVKARLAESRPVLYAAASENPRCFLSPMELWSERTLEARSFTSFSDALAAGFAHRQHHRRVSGLRSTLGSALARRLDKVRKLRRRLDEDLGAQEEPSALRLRGETLLAGLSRARRSPDGSLAFVPDSFDAAEREIAIAVDPRLPLPANAERLFARARKVDRARDELRRRIESLDADLAYWEGLECDLRDAAGVEELEALEEEAGEQGLLPAKPERRAKKAREAPRRGMNPRRFRSRSGNLILVGRSGRGNDQTTFRIAGPNDLWFHAAGIPGAHVVLRLEPGVRPEEGDLEDAASLAAFFSKGREDTRVDVYVTERRNVSKIKGAPPGLVKVQNVRTIRVAPRRPPDAQEA